MIPLLVRPAAAADIEEAFRWYEQRRPGLGHEFLSELQSLEERIAANPLMYPVIHRNTRRALLRRFPYGLFYRVADGFIVILACMHARRDPRLWMSRY